MSADQRSMEDVPFEVRAALYEITLKRATGRKPLTEMLNSLHLGEHYSAIHQQIKGSCNLTPNMLIELCKAYNDFTPLLLLFAEHGIGLSLEIDRPVPTNVIRQIATANKAMGDVNGELASALSDGRVSKSELASIARRATEAMHQMHDVIAAAGKQL